jgi:hypothetical protein
MPGDETNICFSHARYPYRNRRIRPTGVRLPRLQPGSLRCPCKGGKIHHPRTRQPMPRPLRRQCRAWRQTSFRVRVFHRIPIAQAQAVPAKTLAPRSTPAARKALCPLRVPRGGGRNRQKPTAEVLGSWSRPVFHSNAHSARKRSRPSTTGVGMKSHFTCRWSNGTAHDPGQLQRTLIL